MSSYLYVFQFINYYSSGNLKRTSIHWLQMSRDTLDFLYIRELKSVMADSPKFCRRQHLNWTKQILYKTYQVRFEYKQHGKLSRQIVLYSKLSPTTSDTTKLVSYQHYFVSSVIAVERKAQNYLYVHNMKELQNKYVIMANYH